VSAMGSECAAVSAAAGCAAAGCRLYLSNENTGQAYLPLRWPKICLSQAVLILVKRDVVLGSMHVT
jgi:hypothetical protein